MQVMLRTTIGLQQGCIFGGSGVGHCLHRIMLLTDLSTQQPKSQVGGRIIDGVEGPQLGHASPTFRFLMWLCGLVRLPLNTDHPSPLAQIHQPPWENLRGCESSYRESNAYAKRSNADAKRSNADVKRPKAAPSRNNTNEKKNNADAKKSNADAKKSNADAKKPRNSQTHRDY
ncbi:uncharacterized protein NECHADRAFT_89117 [Fusarium vanettenii 77-13-4]|uniref:Uncharacterized protein n=1 Tax=Fusarium vanettenii (strain ATCC MYA-4622 / CBS 123669 / FGSC 9596 / NRRL 45880 / 77-13-4) TaxID=660122 RepID=C7ZQA0_FUSV7|nr:uncharacterized protein NECHADRAFT_89117 [Fusarium vanettenii 77-13-4]EEU33808.1 predicted protein [Fusarium vanettenii 77-13-4]